MFRTSAFLTSAIWRKLFMAFAGLVWIGFVLLHMFGNLLLFAGAEVFNRYSHALISNPLLPLAEALLVAFILVHVVSGVSLYIQNRLAKPQGYSVPPSGSKAPGLAARTMIFSGALLGAFLCLHLAMFKYGPVYRVVYDGREMRDLYRLVTEAFLNPRNVMWYLGSLALVGVHLYHGFSSSFQTLGFHHPRYTPIIENLGIIYSFGVVSGFLTLPLYVTFFL